MFTDYRTKEFLSTTNFPQGPAATAVFGSPPAMELFDLVRQPQDYLDCGGVYDRLLDFLENRKLFDIKTGAPFSGLSPEMRERISEHYGIPLRELARQDAATIRLLDEESHPRWIGERRVPRTLYAALQMSGQEHLIWQHRIVAVPGWLENALIGEELLRLFGRAEVLRTPGFVEQTNFDEHGNYVDCSIRIDLEPYLSRQGFMRPMFQNRILTGFTVYRKLSDDRPFPLQTRSGDLRARDGYQNQGVPVNA